MFTQFLVRIEKINFLMKQKRKRFLFFFRCFGFYSPSKQFDRQRDFARRLLT